MEKGPRTDQVKGWGVSGGPGVLQARLRECSHQQCWLRVPLSYFVPFHELDQARAVLEPAKALELVEGVAVVLGAPDDTGLLPVADALGLLALMLVGGDHAAFLTSSNH